MLIEDIPHEKTSERELVLSAARGRPSNVDGIKRTIARRIHSIQTLLRENCDNTQAKNNDKLLPSLMGCIMSHYIIESHYEAPDDRVMTAI